MNILVFIAHPDDETMLAGGTLALLAEQGACVHYLCATRGEGGEAGDPPVCSQEQLGAVRSQEMANAVKALGGKSLTFLDYIDPKVGPDNALYPFAEDLTEVAQRITDFIQNLGINVLVSHGSNGEYGHPGHLLAHQAARSAIELLGENAPLFYTFQASFPDHPKPHLANQLDEAHLILDIQTVLPKKIAAALCHRSQHALFVRNTERRTGRKSTVPEVVMAVESLRRQNPQVTDGRLDDPFANLLVRSNAVIQPENSHF